MTQRSRNGALQELRRGREDVVLRALAGGGPMSRSELQRHTGLSRSAVYEIVSDLLDGQVLSQESAPLTPGQRGRPAHRVMVNPDAGTYLGIELGRGHIRWAFANAAHHPVATGELAVERTAGWDARLDSAFAQITATVAEHELRVSSLRGAVLGMAGIVHDPRSPDHERLARTAQRLQARLADALGTEVLVENNTRLAALAEVTWGAAAHVDDVLYVRLSEGVSMGVVSRGAQLRGAHDTAGEVGHVPVAADGPLCYCGGHGCLEQYIGLTALANAARDRGASVRDTTGFLAALHEGDPISRAVLHEAVTLAAGVLSTAIGIVDPRCVVIGGELGNLTELVVQPLREAAGRVLPHARRHLQVLPAGLGSMSSALGGVALLATRLRPSPESGSPDALGTGDHVLA